MKTSKESELPIMSDKISYVTLSVRLVLSLGLISLTLGCSSLPQTRSEKAFVVYPHTLVIGLDGIAYSTFKKLQDGGYFRKFNPVAPMIATFPSISDPNWDLLMNLGPEPGFTKAYFDPTIKTSEGFGQESGSLISHIAKEPEYERAMDFKVDGALEHVTTLIWTKTMAKYLLESLERDFLRFTGRDTYFALIINTDLVSHTEGEQAVFDYLVGVEKVINRIERKHLKLHGSENPLEVVIVSDHGNAYFSPQDIPFLPSLEKQGWKVESTIRGPRSVGFFVPEILSVGAFFCASPSRRDLALALARTEKNSKHDVRRREWRHHYF